jgi:PAS domain-containing protein
MPVFALVGATGVPERISPLFEELLGPHALKAEAVVERLAGVLAGNLDTVDLTLVGGNITCAARALAVAGEDGGRRALVWADAPAGGDGGPEMLASLAQRSDAVVWIKDTAGRYIHVNARYQEMMQISAEEIDGRTDAELPARSAADAGRAGAGDRPEPLRLEYTIASVARRPPLAALRFPVLDADGTAVATCTVAAPITDSRIAQHDCVWLLEAERAWRTAAADLRAEVMAAWRVRSTGGAAAIAALAARRGSGRSSSTVTAPATSPEARATDRAEEELAVVRAELDRTTTQLDRTAVELREVTASRDALERQLSEERARVGGLHEASAAAARRAHELVKELAAERERASELERRLEPLTAGHTQAQAEHEKSLAKLAAAAERLMAAERAVSDAQEQAALAEAHATEAEKRVADAEKRAAVAETRVAGSEARAEELEQALSAQREQAAKLERRFADERAAAERLRAGVAGDSSVREEELERLRNQLTAAAAELEVTRAGLAQERALAADAEQRATDADTRMAAAEQRENEARDALAAAEERARIAEVAHAEALQRVESGERERDTEREAASAFAPEPLARAPVPAVDPPAADPDLSLPVSWTTEAQLALSSALAAAGSWRTALKDAIRLIGASGGWDLAIAWAPEQRRQRFACAAMWSRQPDEHARFETATWQSPQAAKSTAVGRAALASGPAWYMELLDVKDAHLASAAAEGMRTALLVPMRNGVETIGVLELGSRGEGCADGAVATALAAVATQLAHVFGLMRAGGAPRWRM